ncbi:tyrosine-type recombinase/integrase [Bacillus sp. JJ1562]|uniref:tyrosine-type recombinase/integrase n=1 Tax=Bacillus sp. JJ1562 TaxID=3122960 RepID=UPI0030024A8D
MTHSENRKGKKVKTDRTIRGRKSVYSLESLFEKAYNAKVAEGLSQHTLFHYRHAHSLLLEYLELKGIKPDIRSLTLDICRAFVTWLLEERPKNDGHKFKPDSDKTPGISPRATNDILKTLRTTFRVLVTDELITDNPFLNVKNVKEPEKLIEVLSVDELKALLNAIDQREYASFRDYVVINVCIDTMCRIGEILSLTVDDVDLTAREIVIKSEITKTRKGRIVPIQQRTARLLKELMIEVEEFESDYIFLANYGEPLTPSHFRKRLAGHAKKAGIKKHIHPHLLRHTAATLYLEAGGNLRYLQALLGHVDQRMTSRYTHLSKRSIAENHDQFSPLNQVIDKLNKPRKIKR